MTSTLERPTTAVEREFFAFACRLGIEEEAPVHIALERFRPERGGQARWAAREFLRSWAHHPSRHR